MNLAEARQLGLRDEERLHEVEPFEPVNLKGPQQRRVIDRLDRSERDRGAHQLCDPRAFDFLERTRARTRTHGPPRPLPLVLPPPEPPPFFEPVRGVARLAAPSRPRRRRPPEAWARAITSRRPSAPWTPKPPREPPDPRPNSPRRAADELTRRPRELDRVRKGFTRARIRSNRPADRSRAFPGPALGDAHVAGDGARHVVGLLCGLERVNSGQAEHITAHCRFGTSHVEQEIEADRKQLRVSAVIAGKHAADHGKLRSSAAAGRSRCSRDPSPDRADRPAITVR